MLNLVILYVFTHAYTKAEPLLQKTVEVFRQVLGENHPVYATTLNNLALLYVFTHAYTKAEPLLQKALQVIRKTLSENHHSAYNVGFLQTLTFSYALLYVRTSRQNLAFSILQESVSAEDKVVGQIFSIASDRQRMSFIKELQSTFDFFLSLVFQQFSQDQTAIKNALDLVIKRKSIGAEAINVQREMILTGKYPQLKSTLVELNNKQMEISRMTLAGPSAQEGFDKYKEYLEQLNIRKEQLETELSRQIPETQLEMSLKTIDCKKVSDALPDETLLIEFVKFSNHNFNASDDNSIIGLQWHSPRYVAFILHHKDQDNIKMIDLGNAEFIDKMITRFRTCIIEERSSQPNDNANWKEIGYDLYNLIFDPLLSAIGDCKKLFIALDGDLSRLPFEVLPMSKDGRTKFLIDNYSITYFTTARDILQMNRMSNGLPSEPIVSANPDYDLDGDRSERMGIMSNTNHTYNDKTGSTEEVIIGIIPGKHSQDFDRRTIKFDRLQETEEEGKEISRLLNVQPWTREKVLESKLKSRRSPKILHIATHGFFLANQERNPNEDKDNALIRTIKEDHGSISTDTLNIFSRLSGQSLEDPMLRSGLALAGANTWIQNKPLREEAEDGILTAVDVSAMDLTNTELVVLSACETGLGEQLRGEGVFGLRRSFVLAGAKTLIMSLWKVRDKETKELMVDFYKRLLIPAKPRADALREAQLEMKRIYPNPYFWGAFICQGNPGPITDT
jgi:CHAT domain-containing protein